MIKKNLTELSNKEVNKICLKQTCKHIVVGFRCLDCPLNYRGNCLKKLIRTINYNKGCLDIEVELEE